MSKILVLAEKPSVGRAVSYTHLISIFNIWYRKGSRTWRESCNTYSYITTICKRFIKNEYKFQRK